MGNDYIRLREIKPVLTAYISEAQALLLKDKIPDVDAVHDTRVLLKKARATLKLIRNQVELEYAEKDIRSLREAARIMAVWRDEAVHRKTLKSLKKEFPTLFRNLEENEKISWFLRKPDELAIDESKIAGDVVQINELFKKTAFRIRFHSLDKLDPGLLIKELENTYMIVKDVFLRCRNSPKTKRLHDFRKKSKDFIYQLYFFRSINPGTIKPLEKKLDEMNRNLGRINDLNQLLNAIGYNYPDENNNDAINELAVRIREKQDEYLESVWPVASRFFCPGKRLDTLLGFKVLVI